MARAFFIAAQGYDVLETDTQAGFFKNSLVATRIRRFLEKTEKNPHLTKITKSDLLWWPSPAAGNEYRDSTENNPISRRGPSRVPSGFTAFLFEPVPLPDNNRFFTFLDKFWRGKSIGAPGRLHILSVAATGKAGSPNYPPRAQLPTSGSWKLDIGSNFQRQTSNFRKLGFNFTLPTSKFRKPDVNFQLPTSGRWMLEVANGALLSGGGPPT